jgi:hypothetical protein
LPFFAPLVDKMASHCQMAETVAETVYHSDANLETVVKAGIVVWRIHDPGIEPSPSPTQPHSQKNLESVDEVGVSRGFLNKASPPIGRRDTATT